jgi:hypothetical protein
MKKFFSCLLLLIFLPLLLTAQQIPYIPIDNFNPQGGYQVISYPFGITAPTSPSVPDDVNGSNQVTFTAGQRVQLHDGFHAGGFTSGGYFHAQIGTAPDFDVAFMQPNQNTPSVGQFEKLEIGITLPATLEQQVNDFLANGTGGLNPFDPEQISVEANFTNGSQSYTVYGFYYDEFIRDQNAMTSFAPANWISQQTNYHWRIRFAPPYQGPWYCSISIRVNNASNYSYAVNGLYFSCYGSGNPGFLTKAGQGGNKWYLMYSGSQSSFFGIGQNIGWNDQVIFNGGVQYTPDTHYPLYQSGYLDILNWITDLSDYGGNMVRVSNFPTSFELELTHLNNYSDRLNYAWELDRLIELCEQKDMKISMGMMDKRFKEFDPVNGDPNDLLLWNNNPYHTQLQSQGVNDPIDFFTNTEAKRIFKNRIRYFMSRWGYSTSLGILDLIGEIDQGRGSSSLSDYATAELNWHSEMLLYAGSLVSYRSMLTSSSYTGPARDYGPPSVFDSPFCAISCSHDYRTEREINIIHFNEFNHKVFSKGTHELWPDEPTYFGEIGLKNTDSQSRDADPGDIEGCDDVSFHNGLWSTSMMGGFCTGMYWWAWSRNDYRHANFPALKAFFNGVDFQSIKFNDPDFWDDAPVNDGNHSTSTIETFYIRNDHANQVMGWVHNATYWYGNIVQNCTDRHLLTINSQPYHYDLSDDDVANNSPTQLPFNTKFEIHGLDIFGHYDLNWYFTRSPGGFYQQFSYQANIFGTLKPTWPGVEADWAYKAIKNGNSFRLSGETPNDTLLCWEDTIRVQGKYGLDTLANFNYFWNFGNGQISHERNPIVVYSQPGSYHVILIVSDSSGWADTLKQTIVKPAPCTSARKTFLTENNVIPSWNAFPNPASNDLILTFDSSWSSTISLTIFTLDGRVVEQQIVSSNENEALPVAQLPSGVYLLRVRDDKHTDVKRIIIEH